MIRTGFQTVDCKLVFREVHAQKRLDEPKVLKTAASPPASCPLPPASFVVGEN